MRIPSKPPPAKPGEVNYGLIDRFTLVHFGIGVAYQVIGLSLIIAFGLAIVWEVIENPLKANFPFLFPHASADTFRNMTGDVLALIAGWTVAHFILRHLL